MLFEQIYKIQNTRLEKNCCVINININKEETFDKISSKINFLVLFVSLKNFFYLCKHNMFIHGNILLFFKSFRKFSYNDW